MSKREINKKKDKVRKARLNRSMIICMIVMWLSVCVKDSHPYSWVIMIICAIYAAIWNHANSWEHDREKK